MHARKTLQVTLLSLLLLVGSFSPIFCYTATAASPAKTILYFMNYDPLSFNNTDDLGNTIMDPNKPTITNDSQWPPKLFVKNKLIPDINSQQWLAWFELWVAFKFMDVLPSDFEEFQDTPELSGFLDLFNPFIVRESYTYNGQEPSEINDKVIFDLYFSSSSKLRHQDNAKISIAKSTFLFPEEITNTTISIKPTIIPGRIKPYTITLDLTNEHIQIKPGETLVFSVEIIPSERAIGKLLTKLHERGFEDKAKKIAGKLADFLEKRRIEKFKDLGSTINEFLNMSQMFASEGVNLTLADFAGLADGMLGSSFVFGSNAHPSKVTVPLQLISESQGNIATYYLHADQTMDQNIPTGNETSKKNLSTTPVLWSAAPLGRNKILKSAEATVYLDYRNLLPLRPITLKASLYDNDKEITSKEITLNRTKLLDLIQKKNHVTTFSFTNLQDYELWYNHNVQFGLSLANGTRLGLRKLYVLSDSSETPSSLQAVFEETTNIDMTSTVNPTTEKIIPGGSVVYTLNITSMYTDTVVTTAITQKKKGNWDISITPSSVSIPAKGSHIVTIYVNSSDVHKTAYNNSVGVLINVTGKTGMVQHFATVTVSKDAIQYGVNGWLVDEGEISIKKGRNLTLSFKVQNNNTGAVDDTDNYKITVTSEHEWNLTYPSSLTEVLIGRNKSVKVTVFVPKNTSLSSDILTFTAVSKSHTATSVQLNVTITVASEGILEMISGFFQYVYDSFKSAADTLGLTDVFGSDLAPIVLAVILFVAIFFIIIVIALLMTTKFVLILSQDRIRKIDPTSEAQFIISLQNPTKKLRTYEISIDDPPSLKWETVLETRSVQVDPRQSKPVMITVKPTSQVEPNDWTEVNLSVKTTGRKKSATLQLMVMIQDGKPLLRITQVSHWPQEFRAGEKVITSFRVENNSPILARNVTAILFINGQEKNKVEGLVIPGRGYAEVTMPWLAVKGKNDVIIHIYKQ